jgi:hypothetical protein
MRVARGGRSALLSSSEDRKLNHLSVAQLRSRIGPETAEIQPLCRNLLYQLVLKSKIEVFSFVQPLAESKKNEKECSSAATLAATLEL